MGDRTEDSLFVLCTADSFFFSINATVWPPQRRQRFKKTQEKHLKRNYFYCHIYIALLAMANCFASYIARIHCLFCARQTVFSFR